MAKKRKSKALFSLKEALQPKQEKEETQEAEAKQLPADSFTVEQVQTHYQDYISNLDSVQKNALETVNLFLENGTIVYQFQSASAQAQFDKLKENYFAGLRNHINNYSFDYTLCIKQDKSTNHLPSKKEIFEQMAKKNPLLLKLKEDLDLDLYG